MDFLWKTELQLLKNHSIFVTQTTCKVCIFQLSDTERYFWLSYRVLSQATTCDDQVYTVKYSNAQPGTQNNLSPMFKDQKRFQIQLKVSAWQFLPF